MLNTAKQTRFYQLANEHSAEIKNLRIKKDSIGIEKLQNQLINQLESEFASKSYKMPEQMRNDYKTIGGTPFLDNEYTVFGEVVEGIEVIDKIAAVEKNKWIEYIEQSHDNRILLFDVQSFEGIKKHSRCQRRKYGRYDHGTYAA